MALLERLKEKLVKTRSNLFGRIAAVLQGRPTFDETTWRALEAILIGADIGVHMSRRILENLRIRVRQNSTADAAAINAMLEQEIESQLASVPLRDFEKSLGAAAPFIILVVGVNGTGKTTTVGKLSHRFAQTGRKVMLVAGDTFRAAAGGQLEIWAQRASVEIVRQPEGSDPASVVFDALTTAKNSKFDVVLIDTAGRLHTKVNLMEELKKIHRVIQKLIPEAPHETLLVLDGTTGQNAIQQARHFSQAVRVTGLVVTKLDGTAKGGVVLAIQQELKIPVMYIGIGEGIDDLVPFDPGPFVRAIVE